jgi:hypothetical protein
MAWHLMEHTAQSGSAFDFVLKRFALCVSLKGLLKSVNSLSVLSNRFFLRRNATTKTTPAATTTAAAADADATVVSSSSRSATKVTYIIGNI